jgi:hypothetical protein
VDLASCTPEALVCDDTGTVTDWRFVLLEVAARVVLLPVLVLVAVALLRRARRPRAPVTRVWVSADGDVVR